MCGASAPPARKVKCVHHPATDFRGKNAGDFGRMHTSDAGIVHLRYHHHSICHYHTAHSSRGTSFAAQVLILTSHVAPVSFPLYLHLPRLLSISCFPHTALLYNTTLPRTTLLCIAEACCQACTKNADCNYFTYSIVETMCYLKTARGTVVRGQLVTAYSSGDVVVSDE